MTDLPFILAVAFLFVCILRTLMINIPEMMAPDDSIVNITAHLILDPVVSYLTAYFIIASAVIIGNHFNHELTIPDFWSLEVLAGAFLLVALFNAKVNYHHDR